LINIELNPTDKDINEFLNLMDSNDTSDINYNTTNFYFYLIYKQLYPNNTGNNDELDTDRHEIESFNRESINLALQFYLLYYAVYVLKLIEYKGKLDTLSKQLADKFYNYGIFSIWNEMHNFYDKYHISSKNKFSNNDYFFSTFDELYADMLVFIERIAVENKINNISTAIAETKNIAKNFIETYVKTLNSQFSDNATKLALSSAISAISDSYPFIGDNMYATLKNNPQQFFESAKEIFNACCWTTGFGGKTWGKIADLMTHKNDMSNILFVDKCWNIQHNNGNWIDTYNVRDKVTLNRILDWNFTGEYDKLINEAEESFIANTEPMDLTESIKRSRISKERHYDTFRSLLIPALLIGGLLANRGKK